MQDRNPANGNKKKEPVQGTSSFKKIPTKVYHVIKPKGNTAMIELKITAETASELTSEIQELAQQVVGTHLCDCQDGKLVEAPVVKAKPKEEKPKKSNKASKPVEDKVETLAETVPVAPVAQPAPVAPVVPQQAPATPAVPVAPVKEYTLEEIQVALQPLMDAGRTNEIVGLMQKYKVASLPELPKDQFPNLVVDLRNLGARI